MASKFYEPALQILKDAKGESLSSNQVRKAILEQYSEIEWGGTQGPIRAMLLAASRQETPIKMVPDSKPPKFFYDDKSNDSIGEPAASQEEVIETAIAQVNDELKTELLKKICDMQDDVFEELVNRLLEKLGFGKHYTTPRSHDKGIDGMLFGDSLGLNVVYVQAKHYIGHSVGRSEIDAFIGALEGRNGVFVTTSSFSKGAKEKAERPGCNSRIATIDGKELVRLMVENNVGVQETDKKFVIKRIDTDFFDELEG